MKYARIVNDVVQEVIELKNDENIENKYHKLFISTLQEIPENVGLSFYLVNGVWVAPTPGPEKPIETDSE
jgi:hypothetical protein